jgi:hypothetical protein
MKFCKDCKWYQDAVEVYGAFGYVLTVQYEMCKHKTVPTITDPVSGKISGIPTPHVLRKTVKYCGPTAKWFEEKEKPIPLCQDCKHLQNQYACGKAWDIALNSHLSVSMRLDELQCGKYGKWWEKKELSPGQLLEINPILKGGKMFGFTVIDDTDKFVKLQKEIRDGMEKERFHGRQSWLCRLICGHHGRLNDKR